MTMAQSRPTERRASDDHSRQHHRGTSTVNIIDCLDTVNDAFQQLRGQLLVTDRDPPTSSRQVRTGQSVTRHGDTNWATDRPRQRRQEGTSESCSNHGSDWNDRDERTRRNRDQSEGRSITFYRGTNWFRGYRARRGGRNRLHSRGKVARPNRVTNWRRDVHEGHEREGSSTICHDRANSTHARRRFWSFA